MTVAAIVLDFLRKPRVMLSITFSALLEFVPCQTAKPPSRNHPQEGRTEENQLFEKLLYIR